MLKSHAAERRAAEQRDGPASLVLRRRCVKLPRRRPPSSETTWPLQRRLKSRLRRSGTSSIKMPGL
jgi:hypothetical protein